MKKSIQIFLFFFLVNNQLSFANDTFFTNSNSFFNKYVSSNKVDYNSIKNNISELDDLIIQIENYKLNSDKNTNKAFLINAYNIFVIKGIITKYPVKSPLDIAGFFDKIKYTIFGKNYTLNDIENKLIREQYNDARFHFVLVCGANGCPPIISNAYMPKTVESQLEEQTKKALNNPSFLKVTNGKIQLSQIFQWYKADFGKNALEFINKYRNEKLNSSAKFSYYSYDWSLNKK